MIGGADSDPARVGEPPITVIRWDHDGLGHTAGQFLINRLTDPRHPRQRRMFPTELVFRRSCAPPAS